MTTTVHTAPVVVTMTGPAVRDGAVVVTDATVVDVGPRAEVLARHAGARVRAHRGVLLPGLVNAHAHLEYGPGFADLAVAGLPFHSWIAQLTARRQRLTPDAWLVEARGSAHAALRHGTTCVGDVVTNGPGVVAAARLGLQGVSYVEAVGADDARWPAERARVAGLLERGGHRMGVSPHTLFTLSATAFREAAQLGRAAGVRLHPHLAETSEEAEFVLAGTGTVAQAMARMGLEHDLTGRGVGRTPVQHCDDLGGLGPDVHVAHGVHVDAADRALLRERGTAVALCTRSNAILAAGEAPVAAYLAEGSPVALGTDSLASTPDLDLLAEAAATRALARRQGLVDGVDAALLRALTVGGAAALGVAAGTVQPGARADLAVVDVPTWQDDATLDPDDPDRLARTLLDHGPGRCTATVLAGRLVHRAAPTDRIAS